MSPKRADAIVEKTYGSTKELALLVEALLIRAGADREYIKRELEQV
jgi:hypothetical protein